MSAGSVHYRRLVSEIPEAAGALRPARRSPTVWGTAAVLVACAAVGLLLLMLTFGFQLEELPAASPEQDAVLAGLLVLDLGVGAVVLALVPLVRRRVPLWAALLVAGGTVISVLAVPAALVTITWVAARRSTRDALLVAGSVVVAAVLGERLNTLVLGLPVTPVWQLVAVATLIVAVPCLIGIVRGRREAETAALEREAASIQREHAALLRQREAEQRETEARLAQAREAERTRIAREMHDSLAHQLSVIAVHAGVLEYRADLDPEATRRAAATVGAAARDAASELRQVLGVLRAGQDGAQPLPDLQRLPDLLAPDVRLELGESTVSADFDAVPAPVSRHAYRIVQEGLTNARKHAPGREALVRIEVTPTEGVRIEIRNVQAGDGPGLGSGRSADPLVGLGTLGSGLGLEGLAERARLVGGWCRAGREAEDFVLRAWLPW